MFGMKCYFDLSLRDSVIISVVIALLLIANVFLFNYGVYTLSSMWEQWL